MSMLTGWLILIRGAMLMVLVARALVPINEGEDDDIN
jgi:hypothetical protein